jgi:hypothetical protein
LGGSAPSKSQENCREVQVPKVFGQARPSNPKKLRNNPRFQNFLGPLKIARNHRKSKFQNLFIAGKLPRFFGRARPSKSQDTMEKSAFREFLGPLKIARNRGKNQISEAPFSQKFA